MEQLVRLQTHEPPEAARVELMHHSAHEWCAAQNETDEQPLRSALAQQAGQSPGFLQRPHDGLLTEHPHPQPD